MKHKNNFFSTQNVFPFSQYRQGIISTGHFFHKALFLHTPLSLSPITSDRLKNIGYVDKWSVSHLGDTLHPKDIENTGLRVFEFNTFN